MSKSFQGSWCLFWILILCGIWPGVIYYLLALRTDIYPVQQQQQQVVVVHQQPTYSAPPQSQQQQQPKINRESLNQKFCSYCGAKLDGKLCSTCGKEN